MEVQKILAERLKSAKEDLRPRKNFKPLTNQGDRPMEWTKFQSKFPRIGWDNDLEKLYLSMLDESDSREAEWTLGLIRNLLMLFKDSVEGLENMTIPPPSFSYLKFHETENILERKVFIFTDASGKKNEGLLGYVAYLRVKYKSGETGWQFEKGSQI